MARPLLNRLVPAPGEGPSRARLDRGFFKARLYGRFEGDRRPRLLARVEGKQDPGYLETAKMLGESALCLAHDPRRAGFEGGVLVGNESSYTLRPEAYPADEDETARVSERAVNLGTVAPHAGYFRLWLGMRF